MNEAQKIADALMTVIKLMVDEPDAVAVNLSPAHLDGTLIEISVKASDAGKIIGKQGRTAKCLRIVALAMAKQANRKITVHFKEVEYRQAKPPSLSL
jgi:uncharacterized protein